MLYGVDILITGLLVVKEDAERYMEFNLLADTG